MGTKKIRILGKLAVFVFVFGVLIMNYPCIANSEPPEVNWRLQSAYPPPEELFPGVPGAYGQAIKLASMVKEASNGHFKIQVFPASALFKTPEIFDAVSTGAIDMAYAASLYWGGKFPEAAVEFGLPGFMVSYQQAKKMVWETDWLKILRRNYEKHGVYLLADVEVAQYNMMLKFPCHRVSDLKGKKIRSSGMYAKAMKMFGAIPVKVEPAEHYIALQRGTVDGTVYPAYAGITYKIFEVAKYATWPGLSKPVLVCMIVNLDAYNKLPQEYKDILNHQAKEWSQWCFDVRAPKVDQYVRDRGPKDFGATMIDFSPETIAEFTSLSEPLWKEYKSKSEDCAKLIDLMNQAKNY
jgi:TRAP-type C4-dicarboxylate transport system substrate-binding protein